MLLQMLSGTGATKPTSIQSVLRGGQNDRILLESITLCPTSQPFSGDVQTCLLQRSLEFRNPNLQKKKKYSVEERDGYIFQYANVSHHFSLKHKLLLVNLKWDCDKSERSACVYTCTERVTCPHPHVISSMVGAGLSIPPCTAVPC